MDKFYKLPLVMNPQPEGGWNKIAARYTVTGTQIGPLSNLPATGKQTEFTGSGICTVEDGKFVEVWNEVDFQKMEHDLR